MGLKVSGHEERIVSQSTGDAMTNTRTPCKNKTKKQNVTVNEYDSEVNNIDYLYIYL